MPEVSSSKAGKLGRRKVGELRAIVEAIEASGGKFYEAPTPERVESELVRDGSYARPFTSLASADPRHRSIRLARAGEPMPQIPGRKSLGRLSEFDQKVIELLEERGSMSASDLGRVLGKVRYLTRRLTLMVRRGMIEHPSWGVYRAAGSSKARKVEIFEGGSRYVEAPHAVEGRGIFAGDLLELSAGPLEVGDLVMEAKEYPSRPATPVRIWKVARVWLKFVVLEGGELRLKLDLFRVTGVFRMFSPALASEEAS